MLPRLFRRNRRSSTSLTVASKVIADSVSPRRTVTPEHVEGLEPRQLLAAQPHAIASQLEVRNLFSNGVSTNQSWVTIPFSGSVRVGDVSKIGVRGFVMDPISKKPRKITVRVLEVVRSTRSSRITAIRTERLLPKFGYIVLYPGAFLDKNNQPLAQQTIHTLEGQNLNRFTLASRVFRPTNHDLFTQTLYPDASTPVDASTAQDPTLVTKRFRSFMNKKLAAGIITQAQFNQAISRFNNTTIQQIVPSATLRAAILSLVGTVGEPAISGMLFGENSTGRPQTIIDFGTISPKADIAETSLTSNGRLRTIFGNAYKGEPFQSLSAKMAHEALHQDLPDGISEEVICNAIEATVYGQQALVDGSFVTSNTSMVKQENSRLLAMLDSGRALFPRIGIQEAPLVNASQGVFFGSTVPSSGKYASFEDYIRRGYEARGFSETNTNGNAMLNQMYKNITGLTNTSNFSTTVIRNIDANQGAISDQDAITLAGTLQLVTSV